MMRRSNFDCFAAAALRSAKGSAPGNTLRMHLFCSESDIALDAYRVYYDIVYTSPDEGGLDFPIYLFLFRDMLSEADLLIVYSKSKSGYVAELMEYARSLNIKVKISHSKKVIIIEKEDRRLDG